MQADVLRCFESSDPAMACGADGGSVSPFIDRRWLEAFKSETVTPVYFRFAAGDEAVGVAAGLRTQSRHRLLQAASKALYLHTGPVPLNEDSGLATDCLNCLYDYVVKNRYVGFFVGSYDYQYEIQRLPFGVNRRVRDEYVLDLSCSLDEQTKKVSKKRRQRINKNIKAGFLVELGSVGSIKDLHKIINITIDRKSKKGFGNYNPYYVKFLTEVVLGKLIENGIARLYVAKLDGELLCANFVVSNRERAFALLGGSTPLGHQLNASSFQYWRMIELLKAEGCKSLNFGGVPHDDSRPNLAQYKQSFGAEKVTRTGAYSYNVQMGSWRDWIARFYRKIS